MVQIDQPPKSAPRFPNLSQSRFFNINHNHDHYHQQRQDFKFRRRSRHGDPLNSQCCLQVHIKRPIDILKRFSSTSSAPLGPGTRFFLFNRLSADHYLTFIIVLSTMSAYQPPSPYENESAILDEAPAPIPQPFVSTVRSPHTILTIES